MSEDEARQHPADEPERPRPPRSDRGPQRNPERGPGTLPAVPGYRIQGVLGRGSTGVVYRAVQLAVDRPVALKVLHPSVSRTRVVRRLQREARTTARLSHPNIVAAIDMGSIDGVWWYAMELVEGLSLAARIQRDGRLTERAALRLFIPLCEALAHLHQNGVVHRDIKPANILIDQNGRARLVDLGLAFAEDDPTLTAQGGTLGTPHYVSPEQARDAGEADVRSDIWSLGASLFHAVTGRPPFLVESSASSVAEVISAVLYARVPDPGDLAPELSRGMRLVLRKCLSRAPERRYQTPEELLEDFERLRERRQVAVQRGELEPVAGHEERVRRYRLLAGVAATVGLLLAAWFTGTAGWSSARSGPAEPGAGLDLGSSVAELEELASGPRNERRALAAGLAKLDELRGELPPEQLGRLAAVRADYQRRYNDAVDLLRSGFRRDLSRALERRDYVAARELVDVGLEDLLVKELAPSRTQLDELRRQFELETRRAEVLAAEDAALESFDLRLRRFLEGTVLSRVEGLVAQQRWRSARDELLVEPGERLEEARISAEGLPAERVRTLLDNARAELLDPALAELEADWGRLDQELARWVNERVALLRAGLDRRSRTDARDLLARDWAEHRMELGLELDQMLVDVSNTVHQVMATRERELAALEEQLRSEDATRLLSERVERLEPLWARREYRELAEAWRASLELTFMRPQERRLELLLLEAELLEGVLARAATELERLAETGEQRVFVVGSIGVEGTVELGGAGDPLAEPFWLRRSSSVAASGTDQLRLGLRSGEGVRQLVTGDVEELAGLEGTGLSPIDQLARALLRWRDGDVTTAAGLLPLPPLGRGDLDALASELVGRVGRSLEERDQDREQRIEEARSIERLINRVIGDSEELHPTDAQETIERIDRLLSEYGDLDFVRRREPELRYFREHRMSAADGTVGPATFTKNFGADTVELDRSARRVRMGFEFDQGSVGGPWSQGDWVSVGAGWQAGGVSSREQLGLDPRWPRLVLRTPLDLDRDLSVEFVLQQPRDSGPPQLTVIQVAGVHVGLTGELESGGPRIAIASGGPEQLGELLDELLEEGGGKPFGGLVRGETHRLKVQLTRGRGRVEVYLDGAMIGFEDLPRPSGKTGAAGVVLRSLEAVRLVSCEIIAHYRLR